MEKNPPSDLRSELRPMPRPTTESEAPSGFEDGVIHPVRRVGSGRGSRHAIVCLLTTPHSASGLSRVVLEHLGQEMPDIEFTLEKRPDVNVIWVLGHDDRAAVQISQLREENPEAVILVTRRGPLDQWASDAIAAGADYAAGWPIPYDRLSQILHREGVRERS